MNIFADVEARVVKALEALKAEGKLPADLVIPMIEVKAPRDATHGDVATNAALVLAKAAKMKPREIADALKTKFEASGGIAIVEVAGPGFLNITFKPEVWQALVRNILKEGNRYGAGSVGKGQKVNLEYVSANPTGPMHVGHCRGAVFGDALANLLQFAGFDVTREYYVNDAGGQIEQLLSTVMWRYRQALGENCQMPEGAYPGDYLVPVGQALAKAHGNGLLKMDQAQAREIIKAETVAAMMADIRADLAQLRIRHDVFFSEASLTKGEDQIAETIAALRAKGYIYEGKLPPPKGELNDDWEDRTQTLFKATAFGDDIDRALQKADGSYTYLAGDIAYHRNKLRRHFDQLINVWGSDHKGYVKRMQAAVLALSDGKQALDIKISEMVNLLNKGEPVKMSKRAGTYITTHEVVAAVGPDPVRFMMCYRAPNTVLDFDFAKVTEQSKDNPVFYVQYAHARAASIFRNTAEQMPDLDMSLKTLEKADLSSLTDEGEISLIKRLDAFPRIVEAAAMAHEPHSIAFYLYDLASALHGQWSRGNDSPHLRFIQSNDGVATTARLALIAATKQVITSGLRILGVEAPDAMR